MSRRLIGYLRVAPRERTEARPGLAVQRAALDRAARERGWELVAVEEDIRSGRTLRRPGLRAALASCRAGEAEGIAVARLDRLTYSLTDLAEIVREAVDGDALRLAGAARGQGAPQPRAPQRAARADVLLDAHQVPAALAGGAVEGGTLHRQAGARLGAFAGGHAEVSDERPGHRRGTLH